MRRKRDRTAAIEGIASDEPHLAARQMRSRDAGVSLPTGSPDVIDDWPAILPVGDRELEMIETYLGQLIGDILKT